MTFRRFIPLVCLLALAAGGALAAAESKSPAQPEAVVQPGAVAQSGAAKGATPSPTAPTAVTAAGAPAAAAKTNIPVPLSPRFQQVRDRIAALFSHRDAEPPEMDPRHNPFRPAGPFVDTTPSGPRGEGAPRALAGDVNLLQLAVASLKVSGIVEIGGRQHRIINSRPYKEGDVIPTQVEGQTVYLRIKAIAPRSLTLSLNEAEFVLRQ